MHSIRHHPASVGTQIRQFGRGATGHRSEQDAAHRRFTCVKPDGRLSQNVMGRRCTWPAPKACFASRSRSLNAPAYDRRLVRVRHSTG